jgi:hypothetical protein
MASRSEIASSRSPIKLGLGVGIFVLTLFTALIHLYLGLGIGNTLFVLNGLGYLGLLALLQLPHLARFRSAARWALVAYAALTIVLFFVMAPYYSVIGYVDKAIEVVLIALLIADAYSPGSSEQTSLTYEEGPV